jgi:hypothetical protein
MAALGADADKEGVQRPRRFGRRPSRLDEHRASVAAADFADAMAAISVGSRQSTTFQ